MSWRSAQMPGQRSRCAVVAYFALEDAHHDRGGEWWSFFVAAVGQVVPWACAQVLCHQATGVTSPLEVRDAACAS